MWFFYSIYQNTKLQRVWKFLMKIASTDTKTALHAEQ